MKLKIKLIILFIFLQLLLFSCSSPRFEFKSCDIFVNNLSEIELSEAQIESVWFAQRKSFLGTYIQEVSKSFEPVENGKGKIPSVTLSYPDVMVGVFLKTNQGSFPLGFFSDRIKKSGILPMSLLQSNLTLKIEEVGGIEGKIFLTAEKRAEDIGLEVRIADSMNPPAEVIWWFPLERDKWNKLILEKNFFPYFLFQEKLFKVSIKIKFCRTRYKMRIMEEKKILEKDFPSLSEAQKELKKELREIKFNLKI